MIDPGIQLRVPLYKHTGKIVLPVFVERPSKPYDLAIFEVRVDYV